MKYFFSVKEARTVEIKIKRSTFIAHLAYVEDIKAAKEFITKIADQHKTANHNCWAYIVGEKGETFHSSDAGEPSGTAGQPMLNMLKKHEMTSISCVVTRYFGGVKLGIRGLIEAYGESVEAAIADKKLLKLVKLKDYQIETDYSFAETFKYQIGQMQAEVVKAEYSEIVKMFLQIEEHFSEDLGEYLQELSAAGKIKLLS